MKGRRRQEEGERAKTRGGGMTYAMVDGGGAWGAVRLAGCFLSLVPWANVWKRCLRDHLCVMMMNKRIVYAQAYKRIHLR